MSKDQLGKSKQTKKSPTKNEKASKKVRFSFFNNISIGLKYLLIFLFSIVLFIGSTFFVYQQLSGAKVQVESSLQSSDLINTVTEMALVIEQQDSLISDYVIVGSGTYIDSYNSLEEELQSIYERLETYFNLNNDEQFLYESIKQHQEDISDTFLNEIAQKRNLNEDIAILHIQVGSTKSSIINLINELNESIGEKHSLSIDHVNRSMNQSVFYLVGINLISIVLGFITLLIISRYISNHLRNVVNATVKIAEGDLTVEPLTYKGKDEIGLLSAAVNQLNENLKNIIVRVTDTSDAVHSSSESLNISSREVKEGSEQMVITMDQLASGAETQASSAADLAEQMNQFVSSVQHSQKDGEEVVASSNQVIHLTEDGAEQMRDSVKQMDRIDRIFKQSVEKVTGLDEKSEQISHLVEVVKGIADQTNLLALNAAIEAARAGDHGRGFAVVAEEVRILAEEVARSVTEITNIVHMIQEETDDVVNTLNNGYADVQTGIEQIEKTGESFNSIEYFISNTVQNITEVANRLKDIATNSEEMNNVINDIAAVSEEAAAGVEQSLAATEETSSAMDEVSNNAEELAKLADQLKNEINIFKL